MIKNIFIATIVSIFGTTFLNAEDVAFWNLNDSLSASSAAESINSLNASKVGSVVFESEGALATSGTSAAFDGSSTLESPYSTTLNPNGSFSVSAWVKPTGGTGSTRSFVSSRAVEKNGYIVRIESNNKFRFYLGDGDWRYVEGPTAALNEWTHVLATFESQSVTDGIHSGIAKIFINGQLHQFKTLTYKPNSSALRPFRIGGGGDKDQGVATVYNFIGSVDEVKLASHVIQPVDLIGYFNNTSGLTREIYYNLPSHGVHLITSSPKYPWYPDVIDSITDFDYPNNLGDNYGARIRGYITIPADGNYTFYLSSDDRGSLRISLDGTEENLQEIATVTGWNAYREFDKYETQTSAVFSLTAGQVLYTEAFVKEGGGSDHLTVAWSKDGGALEVIGNENLSPFMYNFTEQQQLLSDAIAAAQALYTQSADNIGTSVGQYSESSRVNFNVAIAAAQSKLDTETYNGRNLALAIHFLEIAVFEFNGGIKPTKILGTPFGTDPSWSPDTTYLSAHDGDISTHFTYLLNNDGYTGIEVPNGRETAVESIRYYPRSTLFNRMVGGKFQGSADGVNYTTLYIITEEPTAQWYTVDVDDDTAYKFLRYIGPNNSYCNIAELEFLGYQNQQIYMLHHEIISVKANTADQLIPALSLTAEHGGLFPQFLTYKITELPANGEVKVNGLVLALNDTFTQEDINNELLTFSADASRLDVSFKVEVSSSVGGILPEVIVDIKIDSDFDGLSDQQEITLGTDYDNADTNGNGISDSWEHENGMDPVADTLSPLVNEIQGENGLSAAYNYGRFSKISDFSGKSPAKVTKVANINFGNSYWEEFANSGAVHDVGAKFSGYLYVPVEGNYNFILSSDDGSKLYIDGAQVINNDGLHSYTQVSAVVNLSAGFHPIRCEYFEAGGNHGCILQWEGPSRARQVIPASYFFLSIPEHEALEQSIDTDQDGLTDLLEAIELTDPENPDSDGDRLLDGEEYHATYDYKTNPLNVDTDGDTVSDYDEIFIFKSNPLIPDFDGTVLDQINIIPKNTSARLGEWIEDGNEIAAKNRRGALEYDILIPVPGLFRLDLEAAQNISGSNRTNFDIHLYVDGEFVARQEQQITSGETKTYSYLTTHLRAGQHKIRIFWENVYMNSSLRVKSITLTKPGGPDENENGHPDWIDNYTDSLYSINDFSALSKVSPAQLEGKGRYLSKFITSFNDPIQQGTYNRWFTDLTLSKEGPTEFGIEFEHGLKSTTGTVTWEETNILDEGEYTFREGASMLLNAVINGDLDSSSIITVTKDGNNEFFNAAPEEPVEYKFASAGTYTVTAEYTGSQTLTKAITVNVIGAVDTDAPFIWRSKERFWNWDGLSEEVTLEAFGMQFNPTTDGFNLKRNEVLENINIVARLGEGGPIIKSLPTKAFWLRDVVEGTVTVVEELEDGTKITNDTVFGVNIPEGMIIDINTISGVTFPDGSRNSTLTKNDFDHLDRWTIELIKSVDRSGANCHWYKVYQNGIFVGVHNK